jgi:inner membrane protein
MRMPIISVSVVRRLPVRLLVPVWALRGQRETGCPAFGRPVSVRFGPLVLQLCVLPIPQGIPGEEPKPEGTTPLDKRWLPSMTGKTHLIAGGLAAGATLHLLGAPADAWTAGLLLGLIAALLPDIDTEASTASRLIPGYHAVHSGALGRYLAVASLLLYVLKHRGATHSLVAVALVAALAYRFADGWTALAIVAGYASHLVADFVTLEGVSLAWPLYRHPFGLG